VLAQIHADKGVTSVPADMGSALSFALRLKKRNRGANHTHIPKNVAMSVNPGIFSVVVGRYIRWLVCLISSVTCAK
jgi:hypothetical protein